MRAIRVKEFGGPEVLIVEEVPDPRPGPGQVLVRVHAAGVNPVEVYVRAGKYARLPQTPYTPGTDSAGVVEAAGPGVDGFRQGDRVYTFGSATGTYAELALCEVSQVYRLPERVSFAEGAALGVPAGTAWQALFNRGGARAGEALLVHGATGGVGTFAVQFGNLAGLTVFGTAGSESGKELVKSLGAQHVLGHDEAADPEKIRPLTDGRGYDIILEMLANENLAKDLTVLAKFGRVVVIGSRGPIEIDPRMTMANDLDIRGMTLMDATPAQLADVHRAIGRMLEEGSLRPVVNREIPLAQAPAAHEAVMGGESAGKIVLTP